MTQHQQRQEERDSSGGRQRLQRGAKDKVYAERVAAARNSDDCRQVSASLVNRSHSNDSHNQSGHPALQQQQPPSRRGEPRRRSNRRRKTSENEERVERIKTPFYGWPFVANHSNYSSPNNNENCTVSEKWRATTRKKTAAVDDDERGMQKKCAASRCDIHAPEHEETEVPPPIGKLPKTKKTCDDDDETRTMTTSSKASAAEAAASTLSSSLSLSYSSTSSRKGNKVNRTKRVHDNSYSNTTNNQWTCERCTLLNSSRRKKCEVCGTLRRRQQLQLQQHCFFDNDDNDKIDDDNDIYKGVVVGKGGEVETMNGMKRKENNNDDDDIDDKKRRRRTGVITTCERDVMEEEDEEYNNNNTAHLEIKECTTTTAAAAASSSSSTTTTTVNVRLTVSNNRVYDADDAATANTATTTTTAFQMKTTSNKNEDLVLSAIVPTTSIFCRDKKQSNDIVIIADNSKLGCVGTDVTRLLEPTVEESVMTRKGEGGEEKEEVGSDEYECEVLQLQELQQSRASPSVLSKLSAIIDDTSSFTSSSTKARGIQQDTSAAAAAATTTTTTTTTILPRLCNEALDVEIKQQQQQQQPFSSQLPAQSELSSLTDALSSVQKFPQKLQSPYHPLHQQKQQHQVENDRSTINRNKINCNYDDEEDQQLSIQQAPSNNFKEWLKKRKNSRRGKKRCRERCKSTVASDDLGGKKLCIGIDDNGDDCEDDDDDDVGNDDSNCCTGLEYATVFVRLLMPNRDFDETKTTPNDAIDKNDTTNHKFLSAIVPTTIFSDEKDQQSDINNEVDIVDDGRGVGDDAVAKNNFGDAGDCNRPCNKVGFDDTIKYQTSLLNERGKDSLAQLAKENTRHFGVLRGRNETPLCSRQNEQYLSTQGSSSVDAPFPMTQQLPDFDYFTQASIDSPLMQKSAKSLPRCPDQSQDESMSEQNNSAQLKESNIEYLNRNKCNQQDLPPVITSNNNSDKTGDEENKCIRHQEDYCGTDGNVPKSLPSIKNVRPYAVTCSSSGFGFASAGSGKVITVNEEEMSKAERMLAADREKANDYDVDERAGAELLSSSIAAGSNPLSCGFGFAIAGSGKAITVNEEEMAKATRMLVDDTEKDIDYNVHHRHNSPYMNSLFCSDEFDCGKIAQKVRFSLEGDNTGILTRSLTPSKCSGPLAPNKIQSLVTPAKTTLWSNEFSAEDMDSNSKPCELGDVNVVTNYKGTLTDCFGNENNRFSSPLCDSNAYTPLSSSIKGDSSQSKIKSKRLFENPSSAKKPMDGRMKNDSASVALGADVSFSTKITLRQLAKRCQMETEWNNCKDSGVSDVVLQLTSVNAVKLRFSQEDGLPLFFLGQRAAPGCSHVGTVDDIYKWLLEKCFDESLITKKWIQNHYRWIVWKLGSMERRFPSQLGGRYLTYKHVLLQMKSRYEIELCSAKRPSVRKILNRDVSAGGPIVLCVSQILRFATKKKGQESGKNAFTEEIRLELTDGWYGIPAVIDSILQTFVTNAKIRVGSKLIVCNAQVSGSDDGVDPLDESYSPDKRNCPLFLKISANNTRLARWDAKLGFASPKCGGISVKSLRDIYPGGGNIPAIDLVICKRYPKMFLEQMTTGGNKRATHLTEAEEVTRQNEFDLKHQRTGEKHVDTAHNECAKELDEVAPFEWIKMAASNSPEEYYENFSSIEKKIVDDWKQRRPVLLQNMMSKYIGDSMKEESAPERTSNPYVKMLVKTYHSDRTFVSTQAAAEMTVWRVSDEQLDMLKEGAVIRMTNLGVKEKCRDGFLQFQASSETLMVPLSDESKRQLAQSGYEERRPRSILKINLMSKKMGTDRLSNEVDVVACVAKVQHLGDNSTAIYLTDETGLVLKLIRNHSANNSNPFQLLGNTQTHPVVSFCNVQITAFDEIEQCATGSWGLFSCKINRRDPRYEDLESWCHSQRGIDTIGSVCDRLEAGIPVIGGLSNKHQISIGYVLGFFQSDIPTDCQEVNVVIDYGEPIPLVAQIPIHLIQHASQLLQNKELCERAQSTGLVDVTLLNECFQNNQKLFHFSLEVVTCYGGDSPILGITQVSLANVNALSRLLLGKSCFCSDLYVDNSSNT